MRSATFFVFLALSFFSFVRTAPLPLTIGTIHGQDDLRDDSVVPQPPGAGPEHEAAIRTAATEAHNQIMNMKNMLDNEHLHPDLHQHLVNAFGENYKKEEIKKVVNKMATGVMHVGTTNSPSNGFNVATTNGNSKTSRTMFTNHFHAMTPESQVGTVVHEASHAFGITKDYFAQDPHHPEDTKAMSSLDGKNPTPGTNVKNGYLGGDFEHLKATASHEMHRNADSYKVFGHTATHGLNTPLPQKWKPGCEPQHPGAAGQPGSSGSSNSNAKKGGNCQVL